MTNNLSGLPLKHRKSDKKPNTRVYHGPMVIPEDVYESVREDPTLHKTRKRALVARYADGEGVTWLFRCAIPESRKMVGEVVRTPERHWRVCAWSAATLADSYPQARDLMAPDGAGDVSFSPQLANDLFRYETDDIPLPAWKQEDAQ